MRHFRLFQTDICTSEQTMLQFYPRSNHISRNLRKTDAGKKFFLHFQLLARANFPPLQLNFLAMENINRTWIKFLKLHLKSACDRNEKTSWNGEEMCHKHRKLDDVSIVSINFYPRYIAYGWNSEKKVEPTSFSSVHKPMLWRKNPRQQQHSAAA